MKTQITIKKNINKAIKESGKTKKVVCENTGIDYNLLSQYQSVGSRRISTDWILLIAEETGVTIDYLFGK